MDSAAADQYAMDDFQVDLDVLYHGDVPFESKKAMLDIIFNDVVPYRFSEGPRLFPGTDFYFILLNNRNNFAEIWPFFCRFHNWISCLAQASPEVTDLALDNLRNLEAASTLMQMRNEVLHVEASPPSFSNSPTKPPKNDDGAKEAVTEPQTLQERQGDGRSKNGIMTNAEGQHPLIVEELAKPAQFTYRGIIQDLGHFEELDDAYEHHIRREAGLPPQDDPTWPTTQEQQRDCVKRLVQDITNMTDFYELRKARERLATVSGEGIDEQSAETTATDSGPSRKKQRTNKAGKSVSKPRPKGVSKADWELLDQESSPVDLLAAITHHRISDLEIELLCWRLLTAAMKAQRGFALRPLWSGQRTWSTWDYYETFAERWAIICEQLLDCKLLVHSLTRADWVGKFASAPHKERACKLNNDVLNGRRDVQNQVGREVIKAKTGENEWVTSEAFEIRTKEGGIIIKGAQLGDKARRQLAIRGKNHGAGSQVSPDIDHV